MMGVGLGSTSGWRLRAGRVSLPPGSADSEAGEEQKKEKLVELKKKQRDLQDKLAKKLEELKKICLREAVSFTQPALPRCF